MLEENVFFALEELKLEIKLFLNGEKIDARLSFFSFFRFCFIQAQNLNNKEIEKILEFVHFSVRSNSEIQLLQFFLKKD